MIAYEGEYRRQSSNGSLWREGRAAGRAMKYTVANMKGSTWRILYERNSMKGVWRRGMYDRIEGMAEEQVSWKCAGYTKTSNQASSSDPELRLWLKYNFQVRGNYTVQLSMPWF